MQIKVHFRSYFIDVWHLHSLVLDIRGQSVEFSLETKKGIEARSYEGVSKQLYLKKKNLFILLFSRELETLF